MAELTAKQRFWAVAPNSGRDWIADTDAGKAAARDMVAFIEEAEQAFGPGTVNVRVPAPKGDPRVRPLRTVGVLPSSRTKKGRALRDSMMFHAVAHGPRDWKRAAARSAHDHDEED